MSVPVSESQATVVTADDVLAYDEKQLVGYLKTQDRGDEFDISSLAGVESLSRDQRRALAQKLSKAALLLPLNIHDLEARLQQVASRHNDNDNDSPDPELPESPPDSLASTPPPLPPQALEISSRQELARDGGRPVCSMEELSRILAAPTEGHEAILPWLSDDPDSETGAGELKTVFSRQFTQWWDFRKWQWESRGLGDSAAGLAAFIEASRRRWEDAGAQAMVSDPSFDETIQRHWQHMPEPRHRPLEGQTFAVYSSAVKARLARYVNPSLQLRKDPLKQTARTDWLEYLSFEVSYLDTLTATAESLEPRYHQSTRRLRETRHPNRNHAAGGPVLSGKGTNTAKELAAARADRDASHKSVDDFLRETERYTRARRDALHHRHRVEWVVNEARQMEADMTLQRSSAKPRKRKQRDEEPSGPPPKRASTRGRGRRAVAVATRAGPDTVLRRSSRLDKLRRAGPKDSG